MNRVKHFTEAAKKDWPRVGELSLRMQTSPSVDLEKMTCGNGFLHYLAHLSDDKLTNLARFFEGPGLHMANDFGWTPLFVASMWKRPETMKVLLKKGSDPRASDSSGNNILSNVTTNIACTRVLYEHDATLFSEPMHTNIYIWHIFPLYSLSSAEALSFLLAQDNIQVPIDIIGSPGNCTALALAIQKDRKDLVNAFLEAGAKLELALPALKDTVPTWVVSIVLKTKNDRIARLANDVEVISEACWELTQKKRKIDEGEGRSLGEGQ